MKIWAISDTHGMHSQLPIPEGIDMVIHAGDVSNTRDSQTNMKEVYHFLEWFRALNIPKKVLIAGNHDTSIERGYHPLKKMDSKLENITYLEHDTVCVSGIHIFGSPYTPTFGSGWAYNRDRGKLDAYWKHLPDDLDILITHGPPKGILDLSINRSGIIEQCGDSCLLNHVLRVTPKVHIFGHIHNYKNCINQGIREYMDIKFINASCVEDGRFDYGLTSGGVVFDI